MTPNWPPTWSPKMMPTWLNLQDFAKFSSNRHYNKIPEGSELSNMVPNDAKMVAKNDADLALPPRLHQVLIELPL
ncbi:hypothetical protein TNCV_3564111 [Trichonephila clavipes]|nr:hypothetical protein TNCV_3564111 [Trichonephila clavipes]